MGRKKILLADDSGTALLIEQLILSREPYDLVIAKDGQEAVDKALAERPDLVLLDVVMPRLTGFEVLKRLRQEASTRSTPVLMVTTQGGPDNVEAGYAAGCNGYLTKPIDTAELLSKVRRHVDPR